MTWTKEVPCGSGERESKAAKSRIGRSELAAYRCICDKKTKLEQGDGRVRKFKYRTVWYIEEKLKKTMETGLLDILELDKAEWDTLKENKTVLSDELLKKIRERLKTTQEDGKLYALSGAAREEIKEYEKIKEFIPSYSGNEEYYEATLTYRELRTLDRYAKGLEANGECGDGIAGLVEECLLERRWRRLKEKSKLSEPAFQRFRWAKTYTERENLRKIAEAAGLNNEETDRFLKLGHLEVFQNPDSLCTLYAAIEKRLKDRKIHTGQFRDKNLWMDDNIWSDIKGRRRVSQRTLLRLAVGLELSPDQAWGFLGIVDSGFAFDLDILVLACLYNGYDTPEAIWSFLSWYMERGGGYISSNLYREKDLQSTKN